MEVHSSNPENAIQRLAAQALFVAQLDELREKAAARGIPEKLIGLMGVKRCTRCGGPVLVGPEWDVRTNDCERECAA